MTPEQKKAMEYYSPRNRDTRGETRGYSRQDVALRAEQYAQNYAKSYQNRRLKLEARNQVFAASMQNGDQLNQQIGVDSLKREYALAQAQVRNQALEKDYTSGSFQKYTAGMTSFDRQKEILQGKSRNQFAKEDLDSGNYRKHAQDMAAIGREYQALNRQMELTTATIRNQTMAEDLANGAYGKHAEALADLNREHQQMLSQAQRQGEKADWSRRGAYIDETAPLQHQLDKLKQGIEDGTWQSVQKLTKQISEMKRQADLTAKYGSRVGGFLARNQEWLGHASSVAGSAAWSISGRARAGFAGTIQQNRDDFADKMLNREIAGIFMPVKEAGTAIKKWATKQLSGLSGAQQNALMVGGLGLSALTGGYGLYRGYGLARGLYGAIAGRAGPSVAATIAAEAGGSAVGSAAAARLGGPGMLGRVAGTTALGRAGIAAPIAAAAYGTYAGAEGGYYSEMRARGNNKLVSGLAMVGGGLTEGILGLIGSVEGRDRAREYREHTIRPEIRERVDRENGAHRTPTLAGAGFEDIEESYDRLQTSAAEKDEPRVIAPPAPAAPAAPSAESDWDRIGRIIGVSFEGALRAVGLGREERRPVPRPE